MGGGGGGGGRTLLLRSGKAFVIPDKTGKNGRVDVKRCKESAGREHRRRKDDINKIINSKVQRKTFQSNNSVNTVISPTLQAKIYNDSNLFLFIIFL